MSTHYDKWDIAMGVIAPFLYVYAVAFAIGRGESRFALKSGHIFTVVYTIAVVFFHHRLWIWPWAVSGCANGIILSALIKKPPSPKALFGRVKSRIVSFGGAIKKKLPKRKQRTRRKPVPVPA